MIKSYRLFEKLSKIDQPGLFMYPSRSSKYDREAAIPAALALEKKMEKRQKISYERGVEIRVTPPLPDGVFVKIGVNLKDSDKYSLRLTLTIFNDEGKEVEIESEKRLPFEEVLAPFYFDMASFLVASHGREESLIDITLNYALRHHGSVSFLTVHGEYIARFEWKCVASHYVDFPLTRMAKKILQGR